MDIDAFLHLFNWIDKADALRGNLVAAALGKGGGSYIEFLPPLGSCGADVEDTLRKYGIGMWGRGIPRGNKDDATMASEWCCGYVRRTQVRWARYLIARKGCRLANGAQPRTAAVDMPVSWADKARGVAQAQVVAKQPAQPQPAKRKRTSFW